jgi:hypothetical protein
MVVLDGNFALCCGPGTDYPQIHIFQCMLERKDAIMKEVLEPITFVLAYPTVFRISPKRPPCPVQLSSSIQLITVIVLIKVKYFSLTACYILSMKPPCFYS